MPAPTGDRRIPLSRVQALIAERMTAAKSTVPEFTVSIDVDAARATALRADLNAQGLRPVPSVNDFVVRAAALALALAEHPRLNARFDAGALVYHDDVNVGIAVATEEALHVPVIRRADVLPLTALATESRRLAGAVRDGRITPQELAGGTFTVSNLGMFGVSRFTAVINAPQAAILAVGGFDDRARMELTLTCDHRVVYGAHAAAFLARVRELLENPFTILVDVPRTQAA